MNNTVSVQFRHGGNYACMRYVYEYHIDLEVYVIRKVTDLKENS